jgi:hypothetical protein
MNIVDAIKYIISNLDYVIQVNSVTGFNVLNVCSTKSVTVGKIITDENLNEFKVVSVVFNQSITVEGTTDPLSVFIGTQILINKPMFLEGTAISTNNEYLQINQRTSKKTPFIWLLEGYSYDAGTLDSSLLFDSDIKLFIMDFADPNVLNEKQEENVIKPMENLAYMIKDYIDSDYVFPRLTTFKIKPRKRFGVEITNQGNKKLIINENLSGVEVNLNLKMYDTKECEC